MNRIAPEPKLSKHSQTISWVNQLLMDLKLQLAGLEPYEPITVERLNQWHDIHRKSLDDCHLDMRIRR